MRLLGCGGMHYALERAAPRLCAARPAARALRAARPAHQARRRGALGTVLRGEAPHTFAWFYWAKPGKPAVRQTFGTQRCSTVLITVLAFKTTVLNGTQRRILKYSFLLLPN